MNFQTSCMVLVNGEQQQIKLDKWMKGIGWNVRFGNSGPCFLVANTTHSQALWIDIEGQRTREIFARDFIDCGEDIELFKALAAMNNDNDREQWFTDGSDFILCSPYDDWSVLNEALVCSGMKSIGHYRKASKEQIIEHVTQSGHVQQ